ncbi:hypothetical protein [Kutzneria kofuensis]|uniref:hypothetical protein n=1 Tax=Kutzneria kofuensis TaxID=103725 RepID=UPI0031F0D6D7
MAAKIDRRVVVTGTERERDLALAVGVPDEDVLAGPPGPDRAGRADRRGAPGDFRLRRPRHGVAHLSYAYRTPSVVLFVVRLRSSNGARPPTVHTAASRWRRLGAVILSPTIPIPRCSACPSTMCWRVSRR